MRLNDSIRSHIVRCAANYYEAEFNKIVPDDEIVDVGAIAIQLYTLFVPLSTQQILARTPAEFLTRSDTIYVTLGAEGVRDFKLPERLPVPEDHSRWRPYRPDLEDPQMQEIVRKIKSHNQKARLVDSCANSMRTYWWNFVHSDTTVESLIMALPMTRQLLSDYYISKLSAKARKRPDNRTLQYAKQISERYDQLVAEADPLFIDKEENYVNQST